MKSFDAAGRIPSPASWRTRARRAGHTRRRDNIPRGK
jgi:hypothetical protein